MYTTFHLKSAKELNNDILEAIKTTFQSKAITIIVKEDDGELELTNEMKAILDERLQEDVSTYLTSEALISQLENKYGL